MDKLEYPDAILNNTRTIAMNQDTAETLTHQGAKIGLVWVSIGITSWADAASFLAFILSALALTEFVIKKIAIPFGTYMGWLKPRKKKVHLVEVSDDEL